MNISDTERAAIEKTELLDYEQKDLRASGYYLRHHRDKGWGKMGSMDGKEVVLEWNIEGADIPRQEYEVYRPVPKGCFILHINGEEAVINKELFQKIYRWC